MKNKIIIIALLPFFVACNSSNNSAAGSTFQSQVKKPLLMHGLNHYVKNNSLKLRDGDSADNPYILSFLSPNQGSNIEYDEIMVQYFSDQYCSNNQQVGSSVSGSVGSDYTVPYFANWLVNDLPNFQFCGLFPGGCNALFSNGSQQSMRFVVKFAGSGTSNEFAGVCMYNSTNSREIMESQASSSICTSTSCGYSQIYQYPQMFSPTINVQQTGQTPSLPFTAGTGYDGDLSRGVGASGSRFTTASTCITDNLTGLIWDNTNAPVSGSYASAASAASTNNDCGISSWRIPTVNELLTLINFGSNGNNINSLTGIGFNMTGIGFFSSVWTSTAVEQENETSNNWIVLMGDGATQATTNATSTAPFALMVADTSSSLSGYQMAEPYQSGPSGTYDVAWPSPRFLPGSGVEANCVIDKLTGLMWKGDGSLSAGSQSSAIAAVSAMNTNGYCGYYDWRLPNVNEMRTLSNYDAILDDSDNLRTVSYWLNHSGFGFSNIQNNSYWTSSIYLADQSQGYLVSMGDGSIGFDTSNSYGVLPVRGGL